MTTAAAVVHNGGMTLPLEQLRESATNPRKAFDQVKLGELASSIKANGVLQPLIARPHGKGLEIVDGARRFRAAKLAGLVEVPVVVREMTDQQVLEAQVIANLQRADLHPLEEADGYHALIRGGLDAVRISERVGRTAQYVRDRLKLLSLTKEAQKLFREGRILPGHAVILARLKPADQERVIGDEDASPLFVEERVLFSPDELDDDSMAESRKAITPRELQAWVDANVRFDSSSEDVQFLFPETSSNLTRAFEHAEKVVHITHETITPEAAKDGQKVILGRSWKRADGKRDSKTCDKSVLGVIDIGPERGEALRVCINKKGCSVHWSDYQKEAKQRERAVTAGGKTGEDREAIRRQKEEEARKQQLAEQARWAKARPALTAALVAAAKKAPAGAGAPLGKLVLQVAQEQLYYLGPRSNGAPHLGPGKTAEDLVRHIGYSVLLQDLHEFDEAHFVERVKPLGIDVKKILAQAAPTAAAPTTKPATKSNPKPKSKAAKKSRGKKG